VWFVASGAPLVEWRRLSCAAIGLDHITSICGLPARWAELIFFGDGSWLRAVALACCEMRPPDRGLFYFWIYRTSKRHLEDKGYPSPSVTCQSLLKIRLRPVLRVVFCVFLCENGRPGGLPWG